MLWRPETKYIMEIWRRRGRPKRRFLDVVKEDMGEVGMKETDVKDRKCRE